MAEQEFNIAATHPAYKAKIEKWEKMRDTVSGEDAVKEKGKEYLPYKSAMAKMPDTKRRDDSYNAYKKRATYYEIVSPTIQGAVGLAFRKPTKIEMPDSMEYLREEATLDGLDLEGLYRRLFVEVLRVGRYGLLPGPKGEPGNENGEFHIAGYVAETILNWEWQRDSLVYLTLDETTLERNPATNETEKVHRIRELKLQPIEGGLQYTSQMWLKVSGKDQKEEWIPEGELQTATIRGSTPLDFIPFTFIGSTDLTATPDAIPFYGLANLSLRAYRLDADYVHSLHMTGEPTPWATGVSKEEAPPTIGADGLWRSENDDAKFGFLEFSGPGLDAQRRAIEDTFDAAAMYGAHILVDTRRQESGEAKKVRLGNEHASLRSVAITAAAGLEQCLQNIAVWSGLDPTAVSVTPNLDFIDRVLTPQEVVAMVNAWQSRAISRETLFYNLQHGEIVDPNRSYDDEIDSIESEGDPLGAMTEGAT